MLLKIPFLKYRPAPWTIGILFGTTPVEFNALSNNNPVLTAKDVTDVNAKFVADPFMIRHQDKWFLFFEVWDADTHQGAIGLATSEDARRWHYEKIVLKEPFHLSFPYIFQWQEEIYLIPESYQAESIRLYKATNFPIKWTFVGNVMEGRQYVDNAVFRYNEKWWMFTTDRNDGTRSLYLYFSDNLLSSWREHPASPVVKDNGNIARTGGRALVFENRIIRYAQDISTLYGRLVRAFEITSLSETEYRERRIGPDPIIGPTGSGWSAERMHHIDPHKLGDKQWIAVVDGKAKRRLHLYRRHIEISIHRYLKGAAP